MSIGEQFIKLTVPDSLNPKLLHAADLKHYSFAKLAVSHEGMPVILLNDSKRPPSPIRNHRLKYIELNFNSDCLVSNAGICTSGNYSLVSFRSADESLISYFFSIITTFLGTLSACTSDTELMQAYRDLIEIFRSLNEAPSSTIQGLWSELFLIDRSKSPEAVVACWHSNPKNKFDFESGHDKLEVKSTRNLSRVHTFSAEQLNADKSFNILIASIFIIENQSGQSLKELMQSVEAKLKRSMLLFKLRVIAAKTLGAGLEGSANIRYDKIVADSSLRFYDRREIDKIESENIPNRVSEVHFKSDLSMIRPIAPDDLNPQSFLFSSL